MRDSYHELDGELIFANTELSRESYASKKLPYPLVEGSIDAYDELVGTLYALTGPVGDITVNMIRSSYYTSSY